jgi:hypothetical protein
MRISGIIHQQVCQLKWHLLACLALIMVLPIEDAIVNLTAGEGFFSTEVVSFSAMFAPLLAGLIACANVQADLNEKRYIFWRSKPAGIKRLIALKFVVGLIAAFAVLACPLAFGIVTTALCGQEFLGTDVWHLGPLLLLIAIMAYSLCFACNVILRNTARSWLIGMLIVCFLLVLPFMLPLDYKDLVSDVMFGTPVFYPAIMLAASVLAFAFALFAAQHDWHLKTSLKGMLWAGAALVFALMMLFTSQVANIKVLHEDEMNPPRYRYSTLDHAGTRVIYQGHSYVDTNNGNISLRRIESSDLSGDPPAKIGPRPWLKGLHVEIYPLFKMLYTPIGDDLYAFQTETYYRTEGKGSRRQNFYEKVYLGSYKHVGESWTPVCEFDISDCLTDRTDIIRMAMRLIDNKLVACVNDSCIVADVTDPAKLDRIETKLDVLKKRRPWFSQDRQKEFAIPLVPTETIGIEERVKLTIDLNYRYVYGYNDIYKSSIVDVYDGKIRFILVSQEDIASFDVTRWDQENIYCRFSAARPWTILEGMPTSGHSFFDRKFVKNGNLYCYRNDTLMVFDIRSNRRIRKLGHFVRMQYTIEDAVVLENENILLSVRQNLSAPYAPYDTPYDKRKEYLYLLENPG